MPNKIQHAAVKIENFSDLQNELKTSFILFCGSAISGHPINPKLEDGRLENHFLPMVYDVSKVLFKGLAEKLQGGSYYEQLVAYYCQSLIDGSYMSLRLQTKFETLLGQMEDMLGSSKEVQSFLSSLFMCVNQQYGYNHSAIAALIKSQYSLGCLTTNFDNAIELALPINNKFVHPHNPDFTTFQKGMCLLKLHGDVVDGGYVATLSDLLRAEQIEAHRYIQTLLEGKTVLIAGYSGYGDIDISPNLQALITKGTKLIWIIKKGSEPPPFATHYYVSDLWTDETHNTDETLNNCLIQLAQVSGDYINNGFSSPNWQARIKDWFETIDVNKLQNLVLRILSWREDWPSLHLYHTRLLQENITPQQQSIEDKIYYSMLCVRARAYYSAKSTLLNINLLPENTANRVYYYFYLGFADWRLQSLTFSLRNFQAALEIYDAQEMTNIVYRTTNPDYKIISYDEVLRLYLEVSRDILRRLLGSIKKRDFYKEHELEDKSKKLREEVEKLPAISLLSLLVIYYIEYAVDIDFSTDSIINLYQRARNLQSLVEAGAIARLLVLVDRKAGIKAIREVNSDLKAQHNLNNVWQNRLEIARSLSPIKSFYGLESLGARIAFGFKTAIVELGYFMRVRKWNREFRDKKLPKNL